MWQRENVAALWVSEAGCVAVWLSRSLRHEITSVKTPNTSKQLIDYGCALPCLSASRHQQAYMVCFLCPARFYHGLHLNSFSTDLNLTLSWEEFMYGFTQLQGSQKTCSLFQLAHLGRCVCTKDAPPVVIFPSRRGRWNCLPGIYHSFSSW